MNPSARVTTASFGGWYRACPWLLAFLIAANLLIWVWPRGAVTATGLTVNPRWFSYSRPLFTVDGSLKVGGFPAASDSYPSPSLTEADLIQVEPEPVSPVNEDVSNLPPLDSLEPMPLPRVEEASQPQPTTPIPPTSSPGLEASEAGASLSPPQEVQPAVSLSPPPPTRALASAIELSPLEQDMLHRLNSERERVGLNNLAIDAGLVAVARQRSQSMVSLNYFSHTAPNGETAFSLMDTSSINYRYAGENLARNNYPNDASAAVAMEGFMNSGTHRANILGPNYEKVGIGLATTSDGMKYFTLIFLGVNL
nr:hypothetical protein [Chloroflexota bacterium]